MTMTHKQLTTCELEQVYDRLADALDQAMADKRELFLVKLALLCAQELGDPGQFHMLSDTALKDL
ncbi:DUF2783 domain-containing protein [Pseudomonas taetrolens]|uniref:DUF2783 domain-containing protein n=1 Tax=Pseudomonas taetrolens TaxID=47884 RepID=UPI003F9A44DC